MTTLDGVERELTADDLLICDAERAPQAIAGIMGGVDVGGVRRHHRDPARVGVLRARSGIARDVEAARSCAPRRARASSAASTPTASRANAERAMELLVEVAGAQVAADARSTCTRRRSSGRGSRVRTEPGERGPRHRPRRRRRVGRRSRRSGSSSTTEPATATRLVAVAARPSGPTSSARSTSSRRSPAASASTASARTLPRHPRQVGALTPRQQRAPRWSPTCSSASGSREAITLPLVAPADLERCRCARRPGGRGREPAARRGVGAAPRDPARAAARGRRTTPRTASPTSRCSSSGRVFLRRPAGRRRSAARTSPSTSPSCWRARCVRRPVEPDRPVDVYDAVDARHARSSTRCGSHDVDARRRATVAGYPRRARGAGRGRRRTTSARWARSTPRCSTRSGSPAPVVALELDARRAARRGAGATARSARRRAIPASTIDLAFVLDDAVPAADVVRTLRAAGGDLLEDGATVRRVPLRRRSAPGKREPRVRAAVPGARPHAHRRRGRRAPPACIDAVVAAHARRAARMTGVRRTTSGPATPRSTARAWCSTPTGSPTSTRRAPGSSSHSASSPTTGSSGSSTSCS